MYDVGMRSLEKEGTKRSRAVVSQDAIILSLTLSIYLTWTAFLTFVLKVRSEAVKWHIHSVYQNLPSRI